MPPLPALTPLDRPSLYREMELHIASGEPARAMDALGRNPLAVFSWIAVDGVLASYLLGEERVANAFAGLAVLFKRWVEERYAPSVSADDALSVAALACLRAQVEYLGYAFGRLQALPDDARGAARKAHNAMTRAAMCRDAGELSEAIDGFADAAERWAEAGEPYLMAQVAADLAAVLDADGELEQAREQLDRAIDVGRQLGDLERLGRRLLHRGKTALRLADVEAALADYREAQGVFRLTGELPQMAVALLAEGEVLALHGVVEPAVAALEAARATAGQLGDAELASAAEGMLAELTS